MLDGGDGIEVFWVLHRVVRWLEVLWEQGWGRGANFPRDTRSMGLSRVGDNDGRFFQRLELQHQIICVPQRDQMAGEFVKRGYRQSEGDEVIEISIRKSLFRPASGTRPGQKRGRKERPHTGDCWVAEKRSKNQKDLASLIFHFFGRRRLGWRELLMGVQWKVRRRKLLGRWWWCFRLGLKKAGRKSGQGPGGGIYGRKEVERLVVVTKFTSESVHSFSSMKLP